MKVSPIIVNILIATKNVQSMLQSETKDASTTTTFSGLHKPFGLLVNKSDAPTSLKET